MTSESHRRDSETGAVPIQVTVRILRNACEVRSVDYDREGEAEGTAL